MKKYLNKKTIIAYILGILTVICIGFVLYPSEENTSCSGNIGIVNINGTIDINEDPEYYSVSSIEIIKQIEEFDSDPSIKGIILVISSGGGSMQPSEDIMIAVQKVSKPTVSVIQNAGASGAYLIASGTKKIFASRLSEIGGIGVVRNLSDTSEKDLKDGIKYYNFSSAPLKMASEGHSKITFEQQKAIMDSVKKSHDIFVEYIAKNRNIPIEKVRGLATGRTYLGDIALENNLIDQIGGLDEAKDWLSEQIKEEVTYCYPIEKSEEI